MTLYSNDRYEVRQKEDNSGYEVISKQRGVVEFTHASYPRAIVVAMEYDRFMEGHETPEAEDSPSGNVVPFIPRGD